MKKITSLLLTAVLICTMMTFGVIPAFAEETPETVPISSAGELQDFFNNLESGANVRVHMTQTITFNSCVTIKKPCTVTFEGDNNFVVTNNGRAFLIQSDYVSLIFGSSGTRSVINGNDTEYDNPAHAIYIEGSHNTVTGLKVINCRTVEKGSKIGYEGGAICVVGNNNSINNCIFDNCLSISEGGAIWLKGAYNTVASCHFNNCKTYNAGGAINFSEDSNHSTIFDCVFEKCSAERSGGQRGGAVEVYGEDSVIEKCTFTDIKAGSDGGAIFVNNDNCTICKCKFNTCTSGDDGGAIYFADDVDNCTIEACSFTNCSADDCGGAIEYYEVCDYNNVIDCTFENCTSGDDGGAIDVSYNSDVFKVKNCKFINCQAEGDGGAVNICQQCDNCRFEYSNFNNCHASDEDGGGIFFSAGASEGRIYRCIFTDCTADDDGHCVYGREDDTVVEECLPCSESELLYYNCEFEGESPENWDWYDWNKYDDAWWKVLVYGPDYYASVLSEGSIWIIIAIAVVAVGGVAALFIVKKKKKPALADGTENTGEE